MIGLPTENQEDIAGIVELAKKVLEIGEEVRKNPPGPGKIQVNISVSTFKPKPLPLSVGRNVQ